MKELSIVVPTVGENYLLTTLSNLSKRTKEYDLTVVYDTCGRPVNTMLYASLVTGPAPDTILIRKNRGIVGAMNIAMMTCRSEFLVLVPADTLVSVGWWEKLRSVFHSDPLMAMVGDNPSIKPGEVVTNDEDTQPDNATAFRMSVVNEIGGILCAYTTYGSESTEWGRRAKRRGFHFASVGGVCDNNGVDIHTGRDMVNNKEGMDHDCRVLLKAEKLNYQGYDWWQKEI